ncbi:hypothetical protein [Streptomyces sp. NPDC048659]|uniref:hypothetical protein n=1 Tax=Streptomyces sp. NPDC048659 TaxID=3155489 RepID=UPI00343E993E
MKLPVVVHQARLGTAEFRVIRPARPLRHALLTDQDRYLDLRVDEAAARTVAGLWLLAARSPRSLVHLPLRTARPEAQAPDAERGLDLVLLHHSLQFAPARWKRLRAGLGPGRPQTADLPEASRDADTEPVDYTARHHRENRDLFQEHLHAETLFMTGSAKLFRATARLFLDVAHEGPAHPAHLADRHYCASLHSNAGVLGNARELHVEYQPHHEAA